jgi:hypothetical protein
LNKLLEQSSSSNRWLTTYTLQPPPLTHHHNLALELAAGLHQSVEEVAALGERLARGHNDDLLRCEGKGREGGRKFGVSREEESRWSNRNPARKSPTALYITHLLRPATTK